MRITEYASRSLAWLAQLVGRTPHDGTDVRDLRWRDVREDWKPDGSELRDIYVFDTSVEDWQRVRDLVASRWEYAYGHPDEESPLPASMQELFEHIESGGDLSMWNIQPREGLVIHCHFFERERIEFDIYPGDVVGQPDLDAVCEFIRAIGETLEKPVFVCYEARGGSDEAAAMEDAIMRYDPETDTLVRGLPPEPKSLFERWDEDRRRRSDDETTNA